MKLIFGGITHEVNVNKNLIKPLKSNLSLRSALCDTVDSFIARLYLEDWKVLVRKLNEGATHIMQILSWVWSWVNRITELRLLISQNKNTLTGSRALFFFFLLWTFFWQLLIINTETDAMNSRTFEAWRRNRLFTSWTSTRHPSLLNSRGPTVDWQRVWLSPASAPLRQRSDLKHCAGELQHSSIGHRLCSICTFLPPFHFLLSPLTTLSHLPALFPASYNLSLRPMRLAASPRAAVRWFPLDFCAASVTFGFAWCFFFLPSHFPLLSLKAKISHQKTRWVRYQSSQILPEGARNENLKSWNKQMQSHNCDWFPWKTCAHTQGINYWLDIKSGCTHLRFQSRIWTCTSVHFSHLGQGPTASSTCTSFYNFLLN